MTLFRQVAALISLVFIVLLATTTWNDFRHSSHAVEGQLQGAAQVMANTLGLAIASSEQGSSQAFIENLFNVSFDSGYLAYIELVSPSGETIHAKSQIVTVRDVPAWFMRIAPITPATGESQIIRNWRPYGTLRLSLHPGYAYLGLYENLKSVLLWFAVLSSAGLFVLWWLIHLILRPLRKVQEQADAIRENRFIQVDPLPKTMELNRVAQAMNRMARRIQAVFSEQAESLNRYHKLLYRDPLTGLGNRRHIIMELDELCRDVASRHGNLAVLSIHGLAKIKERKGYKETDSLLLELANVIKQGIGKQALRYCARLNEDEFAVYLQGDVGAAEIYLQGVFDAFRDAARRDGVDDIAWLYAGLAPLTEQSTTGSILSGVDFSLTQARVSGEYTLHHETHSNLALPQGKMEWRAWLEESIAKHRFFLVAQPAYDQAGNINHREIFVRLRDKGGQAISAGVFMPIANSLGVDYAVETEVFRLVLSGAKGLTDAPIAVNISTRFFTEPEAMKNLEDFLKKASHIARMPLQIEASHFTVMQHAQAAETLANRVREIGCRFSIDNLDLSLPMDVLQLLRPNYVKVNARTLVGMLENAGPTVLTNLTGLTDGLGIQLIAVGIDSPGTRDTMINANIGFIQGNFVSEPRELA